ncbi:hypothetical protein JCM8097_002822 [Rhodosporidiobolus ruineniae]
MDSLAGSPAPSSRSDDSSAPALRSPRSFNALKDDPLPDLPPPFAALALRKLVAAGLERQGFEGAQEEAMDELEGALAEFFGSLLAYAHQLADHSRRQLPTLQDVVKGCEDLGVGGARELRREVERYTGVEGADSQLPIISVKYQRARSPSPLGPLLPSDDDTPSIPSHLLSPPPSPRAEPGDDSDDSDEDAEFEEVLPTGPDGQPLPSALEAQEARKRKKAEKKERREREKVARQKERERRRRERRKREEEDPFKAGWLPGLPPKHSWKQTPVYPTSAAPPPIPPPISQTQQAPSAAALQHLSTLRARLNDGQLVAQSLRNLIRRTGARALEAGAASAAVGPGVGKEKDGKGKGKELDVGGEAAGGGGEKSKEGSLAPSQAQQAQMDDTVDVVDYEAEWYGVSSSSSIAGGKRRIRVVTVGGVGEDDEREGGDEKKKEGAWAEAGRAGGAAKRRRWLV